MATVFSKKKAVVTAAKVATNVKPEYKIELERWEDVDGYGKARTRILVRSDSVSEAKAELDKVLISLGTSVQVAKTSAVTPVSRKVAAKSAKPARKGKRTYKQGRNLNYDSPSKPDECPDCGAEMISKIVTKKDGSVCRVYVCSVDGNTWWDNEYKVPTEGSTPNDDEVSSVEDLEE